MEELLEASKLLKACMDRYISACSAATAFYNPANTGDHTSPLLDAITNELQVVATYEKDVRNAQSILSRGRNTSSGLVPISSLPSEVLEWIFELAYHTWLRSVDIENFEPIDGEDEDVPEDYTQYDMNVKLPSPMFPEGLTHVCARWRQVALHSRRLWSRIDLPIFSHSYTRLLLRGKTFASRATPSGLDAHILMANNEVKSSHLSRRLDQFYVTVGSKIRALQLTNGVKARTQFFDSYLACLLGASFAHLTPGTLDHLSLIDHYPPWHMFFKKPAPDSGQLDEVLGPIRSLWLKNCFFPWKSPAYCGLVDLRLLQSGKKRPTSIESTQLRDILSACPKLRAFQCSIEIEGANTAAQSVPDPVYLPELEDLHLRRLNHAQQQYILPLISPGPKPLSLSIQVAKPSPT
ncbi:hypothetical protein RSAG8_04157, partial [Rhizoctonia solani AG-8 WAC10335]